MSNQIDEELLKQKQEILDEMVSYMNYGAAEDEEDEEYDPDFEAGYTQEHVDECDRILTDFLTTMSTRSGADESVIVNDVRTVVLALNALNDMPDDPLIETDQREELCALIDAAMKGAGFVPGDDITLKWREW